MFSVNVPDMERIKHFLTNGAYAGRAIRSYIPFSYFGLMSEWPSDANSVYWGKVTLTNGVNAEITNAAVSITMEAGDTHDVFFDDLSPTGDDGPVQFNGWKYRLDGSSTESPNLMAQNIPASVYNLGFVLFPYYVANLYNGAGGLIANTQLKFYARVDSAIGATNYRINAYIDDVLSYTGIFTKAVGDYTGVVVNMGVIWGGAPIGTFTYELVALTTSGDVILGTSGSINQQDIKGSCLYTYTGTVDRSSPANTLVTLFPVNALGGGTLQGSGSSMSFTGALLRRIDGTNFVTAAPINSTTPTNDILTGNGGLLIDCDSSGGSSGWTYGFALAGNISSTPGAPAPFPANEVPVITTFQIP